MEQEVTRITSFSINHDVLLPGLYVSRVDGDVTTYDMRTRRPNTGDLMDNSTMHSLEHMFATYIRNGDLKDSVRECGNYRNLSLAAAKTEAKRYLSELDARPVTFQYKE